MTRAVVRAAKELKKPPYTLAEMLEVLWKEGAKGLVAAMIETLEVQPGAKDDSKAE